MMSCRQTILACLRSFSKDTEERDGQQGDKEEREQELMTLHVCVCVCMRAWVCVYVSNV